MSSNTDSKQLFIKWLTEWKNSSREVGSKMEFVYNKALRSLREHSDPLATGMDCKKLKGFGDKICARLDQRLAQMNGTDVVSTQDKTTTGGREDRQITDLLPQKKKRQLKNTPNKTSSPMRKVAKTKSNANYIPAEGSGGYAILMALIKSELEDNSDSLGKSELQNLAQEFTTTSMTSGVNGSHYNGWHSIKTLINKNLIERSTHRLSSYYLTQTGRDLSLKLYHMFQEKNKSNECDEDILDNYCDVNDDNTSDSESIFPESLVPNPIMRSDSQTTLERRTQTSTQNSLPTNRWVLEPNTYEIVLCVDSREQTSGVNKDMRKTALMAALQQNGVKVEIRTLSVGDFTWIAKHKVDLGSNMATINSRSRKELVLDDVVERKRIDDLASSLKDRRWDEQKYRLINCGIRRPSYIIEYFGSQTKKGDFGGIKYETLDQTIINAEVDGFAMKRCDSFDDTIHYLTLMTRYLEKSFNGKSLYSCSREELVNKVVPNDHFMTYNEFERNANKITNFTVSEMFLKHLIQMKGISVAKAKAIVELYPTLQSLLDAYCIANTLKDKQNLLSLLKSGPMERNMGPNLSKKIFNQYCNQ